MGTTHLLSPLSELKRDRDQKAAQLLAVLNGGTQNVRKTKYELDDRPQSARRCGIVERLMCAM